MLVRLPPRLINYCMYKRHQSRKLKFLRCKTYFFLLGWVTVFLTIFTWLAEQLRSNTSATISKSQLPTRTTVFRGLSVTCQTRFPVAGKPHVSWLPTTSCLTFIPESEPFRIHQSYNIEQKLGTCSVACHYA